MKKKSWLVVILVVCLLIFPSCDDKNNINKKYSSNEIFNMVEDSVAEIITYDKKGKEIALGSGFVYSEDGRIVTNYHVMEKGYSAKVAVNGQNYEVEKVLAYDKEIDVAVLKVSAKKLSSITISNRTVQTGEIVYAMGSSQGLTATISNGIVTHAERDMDGVLCVQHNAAISSGNSGGPLLNEYGEVIGINTFTLKDSQNLNFAISVSELNKISYATPMTTKEFYEKEFDVFNIMKNAVMEQGDYDAEDKEYSLELCSDYSDGYLYTTTMDYDVLDDEITLSLFIYKNSSNNFLISIFIDEVDEVYEWSYIDDNYSFMSGTLYSSIFTSNSKLTYSSYLNISTASLRSSIRDLASSSVILMCLQLDENLKDMGLEAEDLGFTYF